MSCQHIGRQLILLDSDCLPQWLLIDDKFSKFVLALPLKSAWQRYSCCA